MYGFLKTAGILAVAGASGAALGQSEASAKDPKEKASAAHSKETVLTYEIDGALTYVDKFRRPPTGRVQPRAATGPRTLGLKRLRTVWEWNTTRVAGLRAVIRPDAHIPSRNGDDEEKPRREFDSRAGRPYRPMPTRNLLDAYQFVFRPGGETLAFRAGVFERLAPRIAEYPEVLGFGLRTRMPAKFSAVELSYSHSQTLPDQATLKRPPGHWLSLFVLQGNEDRGELWAPADDTRDQAPVAQDPYMGGAIAGGWIPSPPLTLRLMGGSVDHDVEGGKKTDVFVQTGADLALTTLPRAVSVSLAFRYATERWRGGGLHLDDRRQQSVSLTSRMELDPDLWYLFGFQMGQSVRPLAGTDGRETYPVDGYQVETGLLYEYGGPMTAQVMVSHERREKDLPGTGKTGAFGSARSPEAEVTRIGLQIAYKLHEQI